VKRVALLLLPCAAACASLARSGNTGGASSPSAAIQQFLAASQKKDLAGMSAVWGTVDGPASKTIPTKERERRELIMIQCLAHEKAVIGASGPGEAGRLRIPVELSDKIHKATPAFTVVRGPGGKWYVENFELDQLRDQGFCGASRNPGASGPPR